MRTAKRAQRVSARRSVQARLLCCLHAGRQPFTEPNMKRIALLAVVLTAGIAAVQAAADEPAADKPPQRTDLTDAPPPGMNDPGVKPAQSDLDKAKADARNADKPEVAIRKQGDDTIEEYRSSGRVSMIRITSKSGITQTYIDTDGDGRLERNPKEGPAAPVYYKLYEWN
ncbi:MAG: DUF2782 domain-containing protein [Rhodanobacteraceae bacterium]|nr:DUF2782 domain-containing protein [Rhodanobacteraceae bacterium]